MESGESKHHQHSVLPKSSHQQPCSEWIFRDVPSDIVIVVTGGTFALHKFPLVSKSGRIRKLVAEHRDSDISKMELPNLPGGAESFDLAAKFCYGINFEITPANVAQLCCVSDYLEMNEEFSRDNLGSRIDEYLDSVVCKNLEMCVEVLKQCENLLPLADELRIVSRCIDSIASKACAEQMASSFSRLEYSNSGRLQMSRSVKCEGDWWIEDLLVLRIDLFQRVITAMKCRGVRPESIGTALINYAQKELTRRPSLWNLPSQSRPDLVSSTRQERLVVETIVSLLPVEKLVVPINFLFGILRSAVMLDCSVACRLDLERRIGSHLDLATLDDLLIPSFHYTGDTMFDVDTVLRILVNFSQLDDSEDELEDAFVFELDSPRSPSQTALFKVSKLVDAYLAETAPDANLSLSKFMLIAQSLPAHARTLHDGLYRAIDIYLKLFLLHITYSLYAQNLPKSVLAYFTTSDLILCKSLSLQAHQNLSEGDKKRLCKLVDFQKLSQDATAHAAQNERLPIESMVQVLYFEQSRLRNALFCSYPEDEPKPMFQSWRVNSGALSASMSPKDNYASLRRENRELKLELVRMRMRLNDLEKDHVFMKNRMEKSGSHKLMSSFSKRISRLSFFGHSSSRESSSSSKLSRRTDSKAEYSTLLVRHPPVRICIPIPPVTVGKKS